MNPETTHILEQHIRAGHISDATALVASATDYHESERMIHAVLGFKDCPQGVIDSALERFVALRENYAQEHGYWVHSLSHFSHNLWARRPQLQPWIKRLNEIAFTGANDLGNDSCCDRLVGDLMGNLSWDLIPAEYGYTPQNMAWAKAGSYDFELVKALPFASEAGLIKFRFGWPQTFSGWDGDAQACLVNADRFGKAMQRLVELGESTTEFDGELEKRLRASLAGFEADLGNAKKDWQIERLKCAIDKTKAMLAAEIAKKQQ